MPGFLFVSNTDVMLLIAQGAGVFLLVATIILIARRTIYIDASTKAPIEFEFPIIGKVKSQTPAIVIFLIGAALVVFPLTMSRSEEATIEGAITSSGTPLTMVVVAVPHYEQTLAAGGGRFSRPLPLLRDKVSYKVKFIADGVVFQEQEAELKGNKIRVDPVNYQPRLAVEPIPVRKEVSDADLKAMGIN